MAQDAPKRRFLSLIFLVSCISKSLLLRFSYLFFYFIYSFIFFIIIIIFRYAIAYLRTGSYAPVAYASLQKTRSFRNSAGAPDK